MPSIVALFLAGLGCVLGALVVVLGARNVLAWRAAHGPPDRAIVEEHSHLLLLSIVVLGVVRAVAWPLFYLVLDSYVGEMAPLGVMCAFGVTRVEPELVLALQILKPLALWGAGLWLLWALVDRRASTAPLLGIRLAAAVPLGLLALAESAVEIVYVTREKLGATVTCCSQLLTSSAAPSIGLGAMGLTPLPSGASSLWIFGLANALVIGLAARLGRTGIRQGTAGSLVAIVAALFAANNLVITHAAWTVHLAPRVLGLPYHHCVYELLTDTIALGPAAALAVVGNAGLLWPLLLQLRRGQAPEVVGAIQRRVYALCAVALASELLIAAIHGI